MGIPAFFSWLRQRYPAITALCPDPPVGSLCDNLYLDANGLLHQHFWTVSDLVHWRPTEEDLHQRVFDSILRLVNLLCPTTLLYIALDGPAPVAKLQQQRCRRFQAAKEATDREALMAEELTRRGVAPLRADPAVKEQADPCAITAGTGFMARFSAALRRFAAAMCRAEWRHLCVVVSGDAVPGEGEHKIFHYVRSVRQAPLYSPRTRHAAYGADADLIMLALLTHEPQFYIVREADGGIRPAPGPPDADPAAVPGPLPAYQLVDVAAIRANIWGEVQAAGVWPAMAAPPDLERIIDDFVFLCLLCGNDFLPAVPSLVVGDGDIAVLVAAYFRSLPGLGGYLVDGGRPSFSRLAAVLAGLGPEEGGRLAAKSRRWRRWAAVPPHRTPHAAAPGDAPSDSSRTADTASTTTEAQERETAASPTVQPTGRMGRCLWGRQGLEASVAAQVNRLVNAGHRDRLVCHGFAEVRWGQAGWQGRYYAKKLDVHSPATLAHLTQDMARQYARGLAWTMAYYCDACPDWRWAYPYHHAPLLQDLLAALVGAEGEAAGLADFLGCPPLPPAVQLLAVLPPGSAHLLPDPHWAELYRQPPLSLACPSSWRLDVTGCPKKYQGVVLLPFLDVPALLAAALPLLRPEDSPSSSSTAAPTFPEAEAYLSDQHPIAEALAAKDGWRSAADLRFTPPPRTARRPAGPTPATPATVLDVSDLHLVATDASDGVAGGLEEAEGDSDPLEWDAEPPIDVRNAHEMIVGLDLLLPAKRGAGVVHAAARHATPPTPHRAALVPGADALPRCHGPWAGPSAPRRPRWQPGWARAVRHFLRSVARQYVAAAALPDPGARHCRTAQLQQRVAAGVARREEPVRFALALLQELGRLTPKGAGVRNVATWVLDTLEGLVEDSSDVDPRPAQEVWRAWRRDTPGLTALPDVALRLVARLGLWRAAGAAQCVRWLEALLADHQYAQFEAWAPVAASAFDLEETASSLREDAAAAAAGPAEPFPSPADFARAMLQREQWLPFLFLSPACLAEDAAPAWVGEGRRRAVRGAAAQLLAAPRLVAPAQLVFRRLRADPATDCTALLVEAMVTQPTPCITREYYVLQRLGVATPADLLRGLTPDGLTDPELAHLVELCQYAQNQPIGPEAAPL